ncbi:MAG: hypothetical protein Q8K65_05060 [Alphaproteobacteria bacterium]|nr:hypothetical protein [Alphaproteobacteria bacterium]
MATYDEYGPSHDDIRAAFNTASASGARYLLLIDETLEDTYAITNYTNMRAINKPCEVVPLLREMDAQASYASHRLTHVLDLKKDFDAQMAQWGKGGFENALPAFAVQELAEYKKEKDFGRKQAEWQSQPFLARLFSTPPIRPK